MYISLFFLLFLPQDGYGEQNWSFKCVSTRRLFTTDLMLQRKMAVLSHIDQFFHSA